MRWRLQLVAVGLLALAMGCVTMDHFRVGVFHDDAMYVILARALAKGEGFRWINLPDAPAASHFPPGFPLVLSLLWRAWPAFPANVVLFKAFNVACFVAAALLAAQLTRERLETTLYGTAIGVLASIAVPSLVLVTMVLSEPLFLVLVLSVLLAAERLVSEPVSTSPPRAFLVGLLAGLTMLVRMHGAALALALVIVLLVRRRARDAGVAALGVLVPVVPWQLWAALTAEPLARPLEGNYGSYAGWWLRGVHDIGLRMIPMTVSRTTLEASTMFVSLFSPGRSVPAHVITLVALVAVLVASGVVLARRMPVTGLFLALYIAVVAVWPFPPSRFYWGIWPLVLLVLAAPAREAQLPGRWPVPLRAAIAVACAWLCLGYVLYEGRAVRGHWWASISRVASARIDGAVDWASTHTAPSDIIAADDEGAVFLYTGRRTVPVASFTAQHYLMERSAAVEANEGLRPLISRYPVHAVIVGSTKSFEAAGLLASPPNPVLSPPEGFAGGAAFTVLRR